MNIYLTTANIIFVITIILVTVIFSIFIFPMFIKIQSCLNIIDKKLYFKITLLNFKIIGGYIQIIDMGIAIHVKENKAIIIPFNSLDMRNQFSLTKDYKIYSIYNIIETNNKQNSIVPFFLCSVENSISKIIFSIFGYEKTWLNLKNNVLIYEDENVFRINNEIKIIFNLLTISITILKILLRKLIDGREK